MWLIVTERERKRETAPTDRCQSLCKFVRSTRRANFTFLFFCQPCASDRLLSLLLLFFVPFFRYCRRPLIACGMWLGICEYGGAAPAYRQWTLIGAADSASIAVITFAAIIMAGRQSRCNGFYSSRRNWQICKFYQKTNCTWRGKRRVVNEYIIEKVIVGNV